MVMHRTGVLGLCLVPLLFDVALCDELAAASMHQPALVDIEESDPSDSVSLFHSPDADAQRPVPQLVALFDQRPHADRGRFSPSSRPFVGSPLSRPPPPCASVGFTV